MDRFSVNTTQNVHVDYDVASIGDRIVATLIDDLIYLGYILLMAFAASQTNGFGGSDAVAVMLFLPLVFYHLFCEIFMDGRSVGKIVMNTKVMKIDGTQPTLGSYLLRWAFRLIDTVFLYGAIATIAIVSNGRGQRLGDIAARTTVIKLQRKMSLHDTVLTDVQENYQPVFPQVTNLTEKDIATIKDILTKARKTGKWNVIEHLAIKTKSVIGVESNMPHLQFLETIIKDYASYDFREGV